MSFYLKLQIQLDNRKYLMAALREMAKNGELTRFEENEKKESIEIDRNGDIIKIIKAKLGGYELGGDAQVVKSFADRLKQVYALESIKDNMPLDFEIVKETESAGEILLLLKD
jgi:hypothetical protein